MNRPVSIVVPALGDTALLERAFAALQLELNARGAIDEVVLVDDTGEDCLSAFASERFPTVRVIARRSNGGFAAALADGVRAARHELVFAMNSDVAVQSGFLAPLVRALEDRRVFAAVPRILLGGDARRVESEVALEFEDGLARLRQPCLEEPPARAPERGHAIAFAIGGACLFRKRDFESLGGFDALFAPFYFEDVDLSWRAWKAHQRIELCVDSVVEHAHRGTIGRHASSALVRAAIERNVLLFQWKHLDRDELASHIEALEREAASAWLDEDRERLVWLALAFDRLEQAFESRGSGTSDGLRAILRRIDSA